VYFYDVDVKFTGMPCLVVSRHKLCPKEVVYVFNWYTGGHVYVRGRSRFNSVLSTTQQGVVYASMLL